MEQNNQISYRLFLFLVLLLLSPCTQADIHLKFGLYNSDIASDMVRQFRPVLNVLEKKMSTVLGEPVHIQLKITNSYTQSIDNLVAGKVDFVRFGPASYILARQMNSGIQILANEKNNKEKKFSGAIVVKADSNINSLAELAGKRFAFANKNSTTGRYYAQLQLYKNGIKADDLATFDYLGRHDKVASSIASGQYDAGSFKEGTLRKFEKKGINFKILLSYPNVYKPWLARANLDARIFIAIQNSLLNLKDKNALKALKRAGFIPGSDADFAMARKAIDNNPLFWSN